MHPQVVIADLIHDSLEPEREVLRGVAELQALDAHSEEDLIGRIEEADVVLLYHTIIMSHRSIERLARCRLIVRCGVGLDNVDHGFARQRGIPVTNVPDYGTEEVADSAMALMLALTRGTTLLNSSMRGGGEAWNYTKTAPLHRLRGRVFGVVGLGRIGTAAALRAKAFGMDVSYYDPYKPDGYDKAVGVRRLNHFAQLLEQSHVLSLHCPLTTETKHMINAQTLQYMPAGSYLINTARGPVVDTSQIPRAIESGKLAGAGFDVLEQEPPPAGDPLIRAWRDPRHAAHDRVLITPHAAFYSEQGLLDLRIKSAEACRRLFEGEPLRNVVN